MSHERRNPVFYLLGACDIVTGVVFPFALVAPSALTLGFIGVVLINVLVEYGYTQNDSAKKKALECLRKEDSFLRCTNAIYRLSVSAYFPMLISKFYAGGWN